MRIPFESSLARIARDEVEELLAFYVVGRWVQRTTRNVVCLFAVYYISISCTNLSH